MESNKYEKLIKEYKRLLSEGKKLEANELRFNIVTSSLKGVSNGLFHSRWYRIDWRICEC